MHNYIRVILVVLGTARLTRFITTDTLGHWLLVARARHWANTREDVDPNGQRLDRRVTQDHEVDPDNGWRSKLVSGLDCPFCVGFWIGLAVLLGHRLPGARLILTALSLNYVVGHVSSRIDG